MKCLGKHRNQVLFKKEMKIDFSKEKGAQNWMSVGMGVSCSFIYPRPPTYVPKGRKKQECDLSGPPRLGRVARRLLFWQRKHVGSQYSGLILYNYSLNLMFPPSSSISPWHHPFFKRPCAVICWFLCNLLLLFMGAHCREFALNLRRDFGLGLLSMLDSWAGM